MFSKHALVPIEIELPSLEFLPELNDEHDGYSWVKFGSWPKPLHNGLANTLRSKYNQNKLETIIQLVDIIS